MAELDEGQHEAEVEEPIEDLAPLEEEQDDVLGGGGGPGAGRPRG